VVKVLAARVLTVVLPKLHMGNGLQYSHLTHDAAILKATEQDPMYQRVTTPRWFAEATFAQHAVLRRAAEISLPLLMVLGDADPIASPAAGKRLFDGAGSQDKTLKTYEGFLHEVLNETGRERVYSDVLDWYGKRV